MKEAFWVKQPASELMLMIVLFLPLFSNGKNALVTAKVPTTLVSNTCFRSSKSLQMTEQVCN